MSGRDDVRRNVEAGRAAEEAAAAPMMFVEQPPRFDGRGASDVLQLLHALIDTIADDYAQELERYWLEESHLWHDAALCVVGHADVPDKPTDDGRLGLDLGDEEDF